MTTRTTPRSEPRPQWARRVASLLLLVSALALAACSKTQAAPPGTTEPPATEAPTTTTEVPDDGGTRVYKYEPKVGDCFDQRSEDDEKNKKKVADKKYYTGCTAVDPSKGAGAAAPLSVLVAAVGVLALSWLVAQYAKKIQAAGSLYDYVTDGLGARAGAAAGFLYYLGIIGLGGGLLVMIGGTIHDTLLAEFGWDTIPNTGWDLILLALVCFILYFGVGLSTRAQLALAMFSILVVLIFCAYVVVKVGGSIMDDEQALSAILTDIVFMNYVGMQPVLVHGGGPEITAMSEDASIWRI